MSNLNPKTTSSAVTRPNGRTAEDDLSQVPEVILGPTLVETGKSFALSKPYEQFRFLYITYSNLPSLACMQTMIIATRFITGVTNNINLHARISETEYAYSQIGFPTTITLESSYIAGYGAYPNMYVKICGIR